MPRRSEVVRTIDSASFGASMNVRARPFWPNDMPSSKRTLSRETCASSPRMIAVSSAERMNAAKSTSSSTFSMPRSVLRDGGHSMVAQLRTSTLPSSLTLSPSINPSDSDDDPTNMVGLGKSCSLSWTGDGSEPGNIRTPRCSMFSRCTRLTTDDPLGEEFGHDRRRIGLEIIPVAIWCDVKECSRPIFGNREVEGAVTEIEAGRQVAEHLAKLGREIVRPGRELCAWRVPDVDVLAGRRQRQREKLSKRVEDPKLHTGWNVFLQKGGRRDSGTRKAFEVLLGKAGRREVPCRIDPLIRGNGLGDQTGTRGRRKAHRGGHREWRNGQARARREKEK